MSVIKIMSYDESSLMDVIEKINKCVVNVSSVKLLQHAFYRAVPVQGLGSGIIIDSKGKILTNNHVVKGARQITVSLQDGRVLEGRIVGKCSPHDVAIIQVKERDLPAIDLGDSDKLRVGQRVFAVGNPLGLAGGPSVTSGVVSALNRTIKSKRIMMENLVQTDAAINPGNSGGPLVDTMGKVMAINTAIIPYAQGIGFAIPINVAKKCTQEILNHGSVIRPWLGVSGLTITSEMASYYRFPVSRGVLVAEVIGESPAYISGIRRGDIIVVFNGRSINNFGEMVLEIQKKRVGDWVEIRILRDYESRTIRLVLGKPP
jgi:S1-C subfamily serine protease